MKHILVIAIAAALSFLLGLPWVGGALGLTATLLVVIWALKAGFDLFNDAAGNDDGFETFDEELSTLRHRVFNWATGMVENLPHPINWLIGGAGVLLLIVFYYGPCWLMLKAARKCETFAERKGGILYTCQQKMKFWLEDVVECND